MDGLFGQLQQWSRARPGRVALYREQACTLPVLYCTYLVLSLHYIQF